MRNSNLPAVIPTFLLCILVNYGCSKPIGNIPQDEVTSLCQIKRLSFLSFLESRDTINFVYNDRGQPVRGDRKFVGSGSPRYVFQYDNQHRLKDFIGAYNDGAAEFWTRYTYSADNRTVYDTTYTLVLSLPSWPPPYIGDFATSVKTYDAKGRIIQSVNHRNFEAPWTNTYTYDQHGNLVGPSYDNKINYHRTNKVWQFVDDQYSMNNPMPIDAYDILGLPVKIYFSSPTVVMPILFGLEYPQTVIEYDCGEPGNGF